MRSSKETSAWHINGFVGFVLCLASIVVGAIAFFGGADAAEAGAGGALWREIVGTVLMLGGVVCLPGLFVVQPNETRVLVLFGKYTGSVNEAGFHWANPFAVKRRLSLRARNFNSERLKVNDSLGNPIEIGAVVVWRVVDSAKASFDVEDYERFVTLQSETAIRAMATVHPYDSHDETTLSIRGNPAEIAEELRAEMQARLEVAGVAVTETRISHLAYAPEIAQAMLRRQQAIAVIAARQKIVEGAVGMVEMALRMLSEQKVVDLDEERKAAMINNLLVALVSESEAQPVINAGSLY
jgi:nucleotide-binding universal stress UspA family protein